MNPTPRPRRVKPRPLPSVPKDARKAIQLLYGNLVPQIKRDVERDESDADGNPDEAEAVV